MIQRQRQRLGSEKDLIELNHAIREHREEVDLCTGIVLNIVDVIY